MRGLVEKRSLLRLIRSKGKRRLLVVKASLRGIEGVQQRLRYWGIVEASCRLLRGRVSSLQDTQIVRSVKQFREGRMVWRSELRGSKVSLNVSILVSSPVGANHRKGAHELNIATLLLQLSRFVSSDISLAPSRFARTATNEESVLVVGRAARAVRTAESGSTASEANRVHYEVKSFRSAQCH